ncbi:MAG: carboxypeptidase-like regulatory domain-containing protein [Edaphobacter sp.]
MRLKFDKYSVCLTLAIACAFSFSSMTALAQAGSQGTILLTTADSSGAVIPGANLELAEKATNSVRKANTESSGTYSFVGLPIGIYRLKISKPGYATQLFQTIVVQASHTTTVNAVLPVGSVTEVVDVAGASTPLLETSSNAIGTVVDMKQIEDLPLQGRDLTSFSQLVAGYNGTFNGLPSTDQGSNIDGVVGSSNRMKFSGNTQPSVSPRLESIEQMTVQTDQLDLNAGFGQSSTQLNFVSRRGSNRFHGRAYEDFRNSGLNTNTFGNNVAGVRKNKLILNDFGGSIGGPIFRDKLFFFGSFAMSKQPGSVTATNNVFTSSAQGGDFTYQGTDGTTHTVNVLNLAHQSNASLPGTVNSVISQQFGLINKAVGSNGISSTPDLNYNQVQWNSSAPDTRYFPGGRIDYNLSQRVKMYLSTLVTNTFQPTVTAATFPGSDFSNQGAGNSSKNYTLSYGMDFIATPNLINQLKLGYLYNNTKFAYNAAPLYASQPTVFWNVTGDTNNVMSGQVYQAPITTFYPILSASDSVTWQHGSHAVSFGASWYREQDHYYNPPVGFNNYNLGLATGDPALQAFTTSSLPDADNSTVGEAGQLYAVLTGRVSSIAGTFPYSQKTKQFEHTIGAYNLDEVVSATGLFAEDSWKVTPTLTLNYGLRWDFAVPQHDLTGAYHSATPGDIYGPSGLGNLFQPGNLPGNMNPILGTNPGPYASWKLTPQPAFGFAWNPKVTDGPLKSLMGGDGTVIRGGFALRRFTEPGQYFWNNAADYGSFYFQQFFLNPNNTGQTGTFAPGSLSLGQTVPALGYAPTSYQETAQQSDYTFIGGPGVNGLNPKIQQPYSESWNLSIQRSLGSSRVLEVRYNGNRTIHQWININPNEVNIFENGFLAEFKKAQGNLAAYAAAHPNDLNPSFEGNSGSLPIMNAAFGGAGASDFTNAQFVRDLQTGQAGALANVLSGINGTVPYFCNLVGVSFAPCKNNIGYTGAGAGYPINFFQANPYAAGSSTGYMVAAGYSNYNGLQVDLRQGAWKGLQFDANYTWSHSLGLASPNDWTGALTVFSLRNLGQGYGPSRYDLTNVTHINGTYDLPVGHGKAFLSNNAIADKVLGGITVGTIVTFQSGAPFKLTGGNNTFNDYGDGGVVLHGVTASQLQKAIGIRRVPGKSYANFIDPKYITPGKGANPTYITPNTTPGTIGSIVYLHGPHAFYQDLSVSKSIPIHETFRFRLQGEFLNVWNHPVFAGTPDSFNSNNISIQSTGFGQGRVTNQGLGFGRIIELRGNIEF